MEFKLRSLDPAWPRMGPQGPLLKGYTSLITEYLNGVISKNK
jgi:hypothetical protein